MNRALDHGNAIILRQQDYKDNAVLLTVLVQGVGQLRLIAKGQLKTTSKLAPICQPFNELLISYYRKQDTSLGQLINASIRNSRVDLSFHLYQSIYAQILCELIEKISFEDEHDVEMLYPYTSQALDNLFNDDIDDAMAFDLCQLITLMGYQFQIDTSILKDPNIHYYYLDVAEGEIKPVEHETNVGNCLSRNQVVTLLAYSLANGYTQEELEDFDPLPRFVVILLLNYIRYHMGFNLKAMQLLESI